MFELSVGGKLCELSNAQYQRCMLYTHPPVLILREKPWELPRLLK